MTWHAVRSMLDRCLYLRSALSFKIPSWQQDVQTLLNVEEFRQIFRQFGYEDDIDSASA